MKMMVLGCTVMNMESSIKGLLEKWSQLEPQLCKRETRPNQDWHEEFEDIFVASKTGWQLVYIDGSGAYSTRIKEEGLARIQWAVQQAIIEKGWYFKLNNFLNDKGFAAKIISDINKEEISLTISSNPTEALLAAYLKVLEVREVAD